MTVKPSFDLDLHATLTGKRLEGLWRLMQGFRLRYLVAMICLGIAAAAKTSTYLVLRYFTDTFLARPETGETSAAFWQPLLIVAAGFIGLAFIEAASHSSAGGWRHTPLKVWLCACVTSCLITSNA